MKMRTGSRAIPIPWQAFAGGCVHIRARQRAGAERSISDCDSRAEALSDRAARTGVETAGRRQRGARSEQIAFQDCGGGRRPGLDFSAHDLA